MEVGNGGELKLISTKKRDLVIVTITIICIRAKASN